MNSEKWLPVETAPSEKSKESRAKNQSVEKIAKFWPQIICKGLQIPSSKIIITPRKQTTRSTQQVEVFIKAPQVCVQIHTQCILRFSKDVQLQKTCTREIRPRIRIMCNFRQTPCSRQFHQRPPTMLEWAQIFSMMKDNLLQLIRVIWPWIADSQHA